MYIRSKKIFRILCVLLKKKKNLDYQLNKYVIKDDELFLNNNSINYILLNNL